jgi:outer membrane immunogenic protein
VVFSANTDLPKGSAVKKILLGSMALFGLTAAPALAADLGTAPAYQAPYVPAAATYSWTGFYVGAHVGGAWTSTNFTQMNTLFPAVVESASFNAAGFMGGGQIGVNWLATPNILLGVEADGSGTGISASTTTSPGANAPAVVGWNEKVKAFGTVRGRVGVVSNSLLAYVTGGFAWGQDTLSRTQVVAGPNSPAAGLVTSSSPTRTGWTAGGGVEWGFARSWTARLEYLYIDLSSVSFGFSALNQAGATNSFTINQDRLRINTVRFAVNYLFN